MKGLLLLFLFFGITGSSYGQEGRKTLGWLTGSYLSTDGQLTYQNIGRSEYSLSNGIFYNHDLNDNFGFTTSVLMRYENRSTFCFTCPNQTRGNFADAQNHLYYLELPFNFAFHLDLMANTPHRMYVIFGYSYSRLMYFYQTATDQGVTIINNREDLPDLNFRENTHIVNFGVEFRFQVKKDYMFGLTPVARLPVFYLNDPGYIALKLKLGRNL